jgi:hypothetical protein
MAVPIDRQAAMHAIQKLQMRQHAVSQVDAEFGVFGADYFPVFWRAFVDANKFGVAMHETLPALDKC